MKNRAENILYFGLCGFLVGLLISFFLGFSVWVEMRINLANFMLFGMIAGMTIGLFKRTKYYWPFFALEGLILVLLLTTDKVSRVIYLLKDLFIAFGTSTKTISLWIVPVILICNTVILAIMIKNIKRRGKNIQ